MPNTKLKEMKEIPRWRYYLGWAMSVFVSLGITASGMGKIMEAKLLVESLDKINLAEHAVTIGIIEILCVVLYLIPKTSNIGFFLLCSYIGGIIVSEWAMGFPPNVGITLAVVLYVGTMLRKPELSGLGI